MLTRVARLTSGRFRLRLARDTGPPAFNGRTIRLPDPDLLPPNNWRFLLRGWTDHEAAHARFSDPALLPADDPVLLAVANLVEDIRVEALFVRRFPGSARNLQQVLAGPFFGPPKTIPKGIALLWSEGRRLAWGFDPGCSSRKKQLEALVGEDILPRILSADSTGASVDMARRILARLHIKHLPGENDPETPPLQIRAGRPAPPAPENPGTTDGPAHFTLFLDEPARPLPRFAGQPLAPYRVPDDSLDSMAVFVPQPCHPALFFRPAPLVIPRFETSATRGAATISGRIFRGKLALAAAGNPRVFTGRSFGRPADGVAVFLLDMSASMTGRPLMEAAGAAWACALALDRAGCAVEILGYTTHTLLMPLRHPEAKKFGRLESVKIHVFKWFHESLGPRVKQRLGGIPWAELNQNCDPEAFLAASARLFSRPEKKKGLFVLTDGDIVLHGDPAAAKAYLKQAVNTVAGRGKIRVSAVGIGPNGNRVFRYYPNREWAKDPSRLCDKLARLVGRWMARR